MSDSLFKHGAEIVQTERNVKEKLVFLFIPEVPHTSIIHHTTIQGALQYNNITVFEKQKRVTMAGGRGR